MNTEEDLKAIDITGLESYEEKVLVARALKRRSLAGEYDKKDRAEIEEALKEPTGKMLRALTGYTYCIKSRDDKDIIANEAYIYWAENFWKKFRSDNIRHYLGFLRCCMQKGYSKAANYTETECKKYKDAQRIKQRIFDITFRHATYEEFKKDFGALHPYRNIYTASEYEYYMFYYLDDPRDCHFNPDCKESHVFSGDETAKKNAYERSRIVLRLIDFPVLMRCCKKSLKDSLQFKVAYITIEYNYIENARNSFKLGCAKTNHMLTHDDPCSDIYKAGDVIAGFIVPLEWVLGQYETDFVLEVFGGIDLYHLRGKSTNEVIDTIRLLRKMLKPQIRLLEKNIRPSFKEYLKWKIEVECGY